MGEWDDYTGRYHPGQKDYEGFELSSATQRKLDVISQQCRMGYPDEDTCREDADWLESTLHELSKVLANEAEIGYDNVTLKHDVRKVRSLLSRVSVELERLDP
ncbi:MAG: hypothetical protein ACMXYD_02580 [Candidatus Woesearchaeota archaeon]